MNNYRQTFTSSTNLSIPESVYDILISDAYYFRYTKNKKPNISGFINHLIPELSDYKDHLHEVLLSYNHFNEKITKSVEKSIENIYLSPYHFRDELMINVPFRINKERYNEFVLIHDVKLKKYNTDFASYVRNLLIEYASKPIDQRESLYHYRLLVSINKAIDNHNLCHFYSRNGKSSFVPLSIVTSPIIRQNVIIGIDFDKGENIFLKLSHVQNVFLDKKKRKATYSEYKQLRNAVDEYFEAEGLKNFKKMHLIYNDLDI